MVQCAGEIIWRKHRENALVRPLSKVSLSEAREQGAREKAASQHTFESAGRTNVRPDVFSAVASSWGAVRTAYGNVQTELRLKRSFPQPRESGRSSRRR